MTCIVFVNGLGAFSPGNIASHLHQGRLIHFLVPSIADRYIYPSSIICAPARAVLVSPTLHFVLGQGPGAFFPSLFQRLSNRRSIYSLNTLILRTHGLFIMTNNTVTPTECLLQVARTHPFIPAVRHGSSTWSYAALWARVRELAKHIEKLDRSQGPVGLHMGFAFSRSHPNIFP